MTRLSRFIPSDCISDLSRTMAGSPPPLPLPWVGWAPSDLAELAWPCPPGPSTCPWAPRTMPKAPPGPADPSPPYVGPGPPGGFELLIPSPIFADSKNLVPVAV